MNIIQVTVPERATAENIEQLFLERIHSALADNACNLTEIWVQAYRTFKIAVSHPIYKQEPTEP